MALAPRKPRDQKLNTAPRMSRSRPAWAGTGSSSTTYVELIAGDGGDGNDHADWGSARFHRG
ncbi:hypothetical protein OG338_22400 [Streptomyces sp. NBC_00726]|uniref:hypothetical protein n=1 Tax=Streptomyces sp. NBC_00726 TaxID=2903674 RepID=UPI003863E618